MGWSDMRPSGVIRAELGELEPLEEFANALIERAHEEMPTLVEAVGLARELVRWSPELSEDDQRRLLLLTICVLLDADEGHTQTPVEGEPGERHLGKRLEGLLEEDGRESEARALIELVASGRAASAIGPPDGTTPLVLESGRLAVRRVHEAEREFGAALSGFLDGQPAPEVKSAELEAAWRAVESRPTLFKGTEVKLTAEQQSAVKNAVGHALSLVSGGPGTGKTSIVVAILRVLHRLGFESRDIALAAPTGKAAQRMRESATGALESVAEEPEDRALLDTFPEAMTLHRLLGASRRGDWFRHHARNKLPHRIVIIDEASMIDIHLMERLIAAVAEDARIILLGDADQLPSVGPGDVLRSLIPARGDTSQPMASRAVRLTKNFRATDRDEQGRTVLGLTTWIQRPGGPETAALDDRVTLRSRLDELSFEGVEALFTEQPVEPLGDFVELWHETFLAGDKAMQDRLNRIYTLSPSRCFEGPEQDKVKDVLAHFGRVRVLCPTKVFATGSRSLNRRFHERRTRGRTAKRFLPGEPVMMLVNDYERGIFNGDQGVTLRVRESADKPEVTMAVFDCGGVLRAFHLELLERSIDHAYALTVHKAQGSEFERVALILPRDDNALMTREIIYTAVTRARESVCVIGPRRRLVEALDRRLERHVGPLLRREA